MAARELAVDQEACHTALFVSESTRHLERQGWGGCALCYYQVPHLELLLGVHWWRSARGERGGSDLRARGEWGARVKIIHYYAHQAIGTGMASARDQRERWAGPAAVAPNELTVRRMVS